MLLPFFISCKTSKKPVPVNVKFTFQRPAISSIDSFEKQNNGIRVYAPYEIGIVDNYFPGANKFKYGQPLIYIRDTSNLRTAVEYFYSIPDSTIRLIHYEWNSARRKVNIIEDIFNSNRATFSKYFNSVGIDTTETSTETKWTERSMVWENDTVHVKQYMSPLEEPFRNRVLVSWKALQEE
jgi:hypothetical protein